MRRVTGERRQRLPMTDGYYCTPARLAAAVRSLLTQKTGNALAAAVACLLTTNFAIASIRSVAFSQDATPTEYRLMTVTAEM